MISILKLFFLFSGFEFLGKKISEVFDLRNIIKNFSDTFFFNFSLSLSIFLIISYPLFIYGFLNSDFFDKIFLFIILIGILNFILFLFKKKKINLFSHYKTNYLVFTLIFLYFLLSISPITDADSLSYHLNVGKYILEYSRLPTESFQLHNYLSGIGEFLNSFALSINLEIFSSFINFFGLLIIIYIIKNISNLSTLDGKKYLNILYLSLLSCPTIIILVSSGKPQLFYLSLISVCFYSILNLFNNKFDDKNFFKLFIIISFFCFTALLAKISFIIDIFLIYLFIFFYLYKNTKPFFIIKYFSILITFAFIFYFPVLYWKEISFGVNFYKFILNPIPNGVFPDSFLFKNHLSETQIEKFPQNLIIPYNLADLTNTIGFTFFVIILLFFIKFKYKKIILFTIFSTFLIYAFFGPKSPRFYLDIIILSLLVLSSAKFQDFKIFKFFKLGIYLQSIATCLALSYGVLSITPAIINNSFYEKIMSKNANGYDLYKWIDNSIPPNSSFITNHRSTYLSKNKPLFANFTYFYSPQNKNVNKFMFKEIKKFNPNYIVFFGNKNDLKYKNYNFKACVGELVNSKKNVGSHASRKPWKNNSNKYDGYIYKLNSNLLPDCLYK